MTNSTECGDNRFEIIQHAKNKLIEATNVESSPEEMKVLDNILFRMWQMGWLPDLENEKVPVVHAHWIWRLFLQKTFYECSKCGKYSSLDTDYCGSCGAKMDEVYGREKLNQIQNLIFIRKLN